MVTYKGGEGESIETAVEILGVTDPFSGIHAEYNWLESRYGQQGKGWNLISQSVLPREEQGKVYDLLNIRLADGVQKLFYFDITSFINDLF